MVVEWQAVYRDMLYIIVRQEERCLFKKQSWHVSRRATQCGTLIKCHVL